jgi:uncharacterized protein (DUF58 family)
VSEPADWRARLAEINFARLNYILIPDSPEAMEKARSGWAARYLGGPIVWLFRALTRQGQAVLLLTLFVGMGALDVGESSNHVLASILFSALVGSLAIRRGVAMKNVSVVVETPPRVAAGEELVVRLTLINRDPRRHTAIELSRPFLPWDGTWVTPRIVVHALEPDETLTLQTRARFEARGRHYLEPFHASASVPMRLALGPGVKSVGTPLLVVPRVAPIQHIQLGMTPRFQPGGVALASKTGESSELYGLRPYRRGDRLRDLHARSWARTGKPVVREYQQEYFTRVGVFLDTDLQTTTEVGFEAGISLAAGVVLNLSRGEALIDLLVTGDTLHALTVGRSLGTFEQALDHLACTQAGPVFDCARTVELLAAHLSRLSSMVLVVHTWDASRQKLAQLLRVRGVAVKVLVVGEGASTRDVTHVRVDQIQGDAGLIL